MSTYFGNHIVLGTMPSNTSVPEIGPRVYVGFGNSQVILTADEADRLATKLAGLAATARVETARVETARALADETEPATEPGRQLCGCPTSRGHHFFDAGCTR